MNPGYKKKVWVGWGWVGWGHGGQGAGGGGGVMADFKI
jgi:hypothetical protein